MKKIFISILIIMMIIITAVILKDTIVTDSTANNDRFIKILDEGQYEIWCDRKTKVLYLQSCQGGGYQGYGGLTVLVNKDGKPLLYGEE